MLNPPVPPSEKRLVYWFPVPPQVRRFSKLSGKPIVTEVALVEGTNEDEKLAMAEANGSNLVYVQAMVRRTLWGYNEAALGDSLGGSPDPKGRRIFNRGSQDPNELPDFVYETWQSQVQSLCHTAFSRIHGVDQEVGKAFLDGMSVTTS